MSFYLRPRPDLPLAQGDIFIDVPVIGGDFRLNQVVHEGANARLVPVEAAALRADMYLANRIHLTRAIVISQSCDCERADRLILAPLSEFQVAGKNNEKRWRCIGDAATSLYETKAFYLPGNGPLGLGRATAEFGEAFTLPRLLLEELARHGKRVARLSDRAIAYLQFRLAVMLTRVAQDDYAWPSADDLKYKLAYYDDLLRKKEQAVKEAEGALRQATPDNRIQQEEHLRWARYERDQVLQWREQAAAAQKVADDVDEAHLAAPTTQGPTEPSAPLHTEHEAAAPRDSAAVAAAPANQTPPPSPPRRRGWWFYLLLVFVGAVVGCLGCWLAHQFWPMTPVAPP